MTTRPPTTTAESFSLVTGPGRAPLTWREVNALGRVLGTVPAFAPVPVYARER